ncbi:hypothetical protein C3Z13_03615 [Avibacterium endocarditidis]|uniref:Uncharacterized protein n=1 Tax=Avibacterium endocarditidis TaxID=380674 RepID=A0ABX4ZT88_9PAST|nr:hypothetical protein C3Z13_03615 [Avibacterium endocarditidis]
MLSTRKFLSVTAASDAKPPLSVAFPDSFNVLFSFLSRISPVSPSKRKPSFKVATSSLSPFGFS